MKYRPYPQGLSSALIHWLRQSPFSNLVLDDRYSSLESLNSLLDNSQAGSREHQTMGIEIHHDDPGQADFGIFGDLSLTAIESISYPSGIQQWFDQIKAKSLEHSFPQKFWLEFDSDASGYRLMGLFQNCDRCSCDSDTIVELLLQHGDPKGFLASTLQQIGVPDWIGLIDRWQEYVKLVIPLHGEFSEPLAAFVARWFMPQLSNAGVSPEVMVKILQSWADNGLIRLSVDCRLTQDLPGRRLCFELFEREHESDSRHNPDAFQLLLERLHIPADQIIRFQQLRGRLPHASKRPSFNLVDEDYFLLAASHAKICFDTDNVSLKDYLWLSGGLQERITDQFRGF